MQSALSSAEDDYRAFEELVRRYEGRVQTNCRYLSGSPDEAEDLAQEVMVKLFFGLRSFEGRSSFRTWMMRIKSNHCINFVKKRRIETVELEDHANPGRAASVPPDAWRGLEKAEAAQRVREVLLKLPESLRIPLVLRDMDGLEYREIAADMGIGLSAAKMRIMRGRAEFRRLLGQSVASPEAETTAR